jgi:Protein of unknown function (DUF1579)
MKSFPFSLLLCVACGSASTVDLPAPPKPSPSPEHEWLHQFVGEWSVATETIVAEGAAPEKWEGSEVVRSLGGLWIIGEGSAPMNDAMHLWILTLGYDSTQGGFVGTWIDTMQTRIWTYRGSLDAERKSLTLEAQGPGFADPNVTANYRDTFTIVDADTKRLESSVQNADGSWTKYVRSEFRRKR